MRDPDDQKPYAVECPRCGAARNHGCFDLRTDWNTNIRPHRERIKAWNALLRLAKA